PALFGKTGSGGEKPVSMAAESVPLWRQVAKQSVWGRRGIAKASSLWLPLVLILGPFIPGNPSLLWNVFRIFFIVVLWESASILANDLSDCRADLAAGKRRWICSLSRQTASAIIILLVASGWLFLLLFKSPLATIGAYSGSIFLGLAYSIPPLRFKERGGLGILAYSLACTLAYVFIPWTWVGARALSLLILTPAVFLDKWVNLHFHQVLDFPADSTGHTLTYAVRAGIEPATRRLQFAAALASLSFLAVMAWSVSLFPAWSLIILTSAVGTTLAGAAFVRLRRAQASSQTALLRELPWFYLSLTFAVFRVLPLVLLAGMALLESRLWAAFGLAFLVIAAESRYLYFYRLE
ncbi:MAG: UbiA family prenyltransferase, partial [Acidobacteriota bacterium]